MCFITFDKVEGKIVVLSGLEAELILRGYSKLKQFKTTFPSMEKAPEPQDIIWENCNITVGE